MDGGGFFVVGLAALFFCMLAVLIALLWRVAMALERMAKHLFEIARDVKKPSPPPGDEKA
jgi:hypothetical protein